MERSLFSEILRIAIRQAASLSMELASYQRPDGDLEFAKYVEDIPDHYRWTLWSGIQYCANAFKNRRFTKIAKDFGRHIPEEWKKMNSY